MKHPCQGKVRYASYDEAGLALVNAKIRRAFGRAGWQKRREERVYYCGDCNGFHLSSLPEDGRRRAS
jgi:hypothetical protein